MTKAMREVFEDMMAAGYSYEDMVCALAEIEQEKKIREAEIAAQKEKELKEKEQNLYDARMQFFYSMIDYLEALDLIDSSAITEEDVDAYIEKIQEIEKNVMMLRQFEQNLPDLFSTGENDRKKVKTYVIKDPSSLDNDKLQKFLKSIM